MDYDRRVSTNRTRIEVLPLIVAIIAVFLIVMATLTYTAFGATDFWDYPPSLLLRGLGHVFSGH